MPQFPLPEPKDGEKQDTFVSRCIEFVRTEDERMPQGQAAAICFTQWKEAKKMNDKDKKAAEIWISGLELAAKGKPKDEIMIFPFGEFKHPQYGDLKFDNKFFQRVIRNFKNNVLGTIPFMDKEHNKGEALAWFKEAPYIKAGEGLFIKPEWTTTGMTALKEGLYRYFSPWYQDFTDPQTQKTYKDVLRGGGATNIPFLKTMPPIVDDGAQLSEIDIMLSDIYADKVLAIGYDEQSESDNINLNEEQGMYKKLAELLGLAEDAKEAEILKAVSALKKGKEAAEKSTEKKADEVEAQPEPEQKKEEKKEDAQLSEREVALEKRVNELTQKILTKEASDVVGKALSEGKIKPADREYWEARYLADPVNIAIDIDHFPKAVELAELGVSGNVGEPKTLSAASQIMAEADKVAKEKNITLSEAISVVASSNPELYEKYQKEARK